MSASNSSEITPQQIGKAFVVQYYRLLHEHPESLHRFYSSSSTLMHDDPNRTVTGIEEITKRIEELALKQRQVKIRQVDCHSTVGSSVVVQVCGEISSTSVSSDNPTGIMKRFVQTFILAPADNNKQKYYVHNDIFRYQDNPILENSPTKPANPQTPTSSINIQFTSSPMVKRENAARMEASSSVGQEETSTKPKSYRDAIGKKEKVPIPSNETPPATASGTTKSKKKSKSSNRTSRGHPQDTTEDYCDDSWYYGSGEEGYLHTGYIDDQEVFVANLSAQVTEQEVRRRFILMRLVLFVDRFENYFDRMEIYCIFELEILDHRLVQRILLLLFVNRLKWQKQLLLIMIIYSKINK